MNYHQSQQILEEIKKAKNILLFCHKSPDLDSIISCLTMSKVLLKLGISSKIYSVDKIPDQFRPIDDENIIVDNFDISKIDLNKFDLLLAIDVSELIRLGFDSNNDKGIPVINIDHHLEKNDMIATLKLLDISLSSSSEAVFLLSKDWGIELDKKDLQKILTGIVNDTSGFTYSFSARMFKTIATLIDGGANMEETNQFLYRRNNIDNLHYWSEMLKNIKIDKEHSFAYSVLSFEEYSKFKNIIQATRTIGDMFIRTINDTNFGIVMVETKSQELNISIRSRNMGYGVIELLKTLGGGGHFDGGGATVKGMPFEKAVEYVLDSAREFVKNRK